MEGRADAELSFFLLCVSPSFSLASSQGLNLLDYFVWGCRQQMVGSRKRRINFKESAPGLSVPRRGKLNAGRRSERARETLEIAWTLVIIQSCFPFLLPPPPSSILVTFANRRSLKGCRPMVARIGNASIIIIPRNLQRNSVVSLELILPQFHSIFEWPFFDRGVISLT